MKNIYVLDIFETQITGFTTYKEAFFACLSGCNEISLNHIIFHYPTDEFTVIQIGEVREFRIPAIKVSDFRELALVTGEILKLYIEDKAENIFIQNFAPSYAIVLGIKEIFPLSKIVYVIHDFIWASFLLGNVEKFKQLVTQPQFRENIRSIYSAYEDGKNTFRLVDRVVCLSQDTFDLIHTFYSVCKDKLVIIPNGYKGECRETSFSDKRELKKKVHLENCQVLLFVGRVCKQKGVLDLLDGFDKVLTVHPDCYLVLAGKVDPDILTTIKDSIRTHVLFLGAISKKELNDWYRIADIGVVPSYYEQCSYTGIEMKMFRLPVVASDAFGVKNMFDYRNAIIAHIDYSAFEVYSSRLAEACLQLLESEDKRLLLAKRSGNDFQKLYGITRMRIDYLNTFFQIN